MLVLQASTLLYPAPLLWNTRTDYAIFQAASPLAKKYCRGRNVTAKCRCFSRYPWVLSASLGCSWIVRAVQLKTQTGRHGGLANCHTQAIGKCMLKERCWPTTSSLKSVAYVRCFQKKRCSRSTEVHPLVGWGFRQTAKPSLSRKAAWFTHPLLLSFE